MTQLNTKLKTLKALFERYQKAQEVLKQSQTEALILYDLYLQESEKVAQLFLKKNLSELTTDDGKFLLKPLIRAKIINRELAEKYDEKYQLGLFKKTLSGMRLKAWAKELRSKGLSLPEFLSVDEQYTIEIQ